MIRLMTAVSLLALLSACGDGNPLFDENGNRLNADGNSANTDTTGDANADPTEGDIDNDGATPPPGTEDPELEQSIFRFEERDNNGAGLVTQVSYNSNRDTFTVDNLAFDGANVYKRNAPLGTVGGYRVFAADETTDDFLTGNAVNQIVPYRAIYGVSNRRVDGDPRTSFAVVRTGGYVGYGFGGFVYERKGGAVLPETGQATFAGDYGGVVNFDGIGGLAYVQGDMRLDIDFEDFNANAGVKGVIENRVLIAEDGSALGTFDTIRWVVEEGTMTLDENGEIITQVFSTRVDREQNALVQFFDGQFTGLLAGDLTRNNDGGEVVGIIDMEASAIIEDPNNLGELTGGFVPDGDNGEGTPITIRETGGAILSRN